MLLILKQFINNNNWPTRHISKPKTTLINDFQKIPKVLGQKFTIFPECTGIPKIFDRVETPDLRSRLSLAPYLVMPFSTSHYNNHLCVRIYLQK